MSDLGRITDFMETTTHAVKASDDVLKAVRALVSKGVTGVPVVDEKNAVVGMLGESDCLRLLTHPGEGVERVEQLMRKEVQSVSPDMDVAYVAGMFNKQPYRRFPVVKDGQLVGVVTRKDILRAVLEMSG